MAGTAGKRASFLLPRFSGTGSSVLGKEGPVNLGFAAVFTTVAMAMGAAVVTVAGVTLSERFDTLNVLAEISTQSGLKAHAFLRNLIAVIVASGACIAVSGCMGTVGAKRNTKLLVVMCSVLGTAAAAAMMFATVSSNLFLLDLVTVMCEEEDCNPRDAGFTNQQLDILSASLAMFDECCLAQHETFSEEAKLATDSLGFTDISLFETRVQQVAYPECPEEGPVEAVCENKVPPVIAELLNFERRLCTCIPNDSYTQVVLTLQAMKNNSETGCSALGTATFAITDDIFVPTTPSRVLNLLAGQYRDYFLLNKDELVGFNVPLVGTPAPPYIPGDNPNGGFGCGLGVSKGFMWYQALMLEEYLRPILSTASACASVTIVCSILALIFVFIAKRDQLETMDEGGSFALSAPSNFTRSAVPQRTPEASEILVSAEVHGEEGSKTTTTTEEESPESTITDPESPKRSDSEELNAQNLAKRLKAFYLAHEPSKLDRFGGSADPVVFALANGEEALNVKLRAKFNADLSTFN